MSQLTADQKQYAVDLLGEMVRIPSVNKNAEQADRDQAEKRVGEYLEKRLASMGMEVRRVPMTVGRDNLVAQYPGDTGPATIAFQSHMDTVGVDNMTVDPFGAEIRDGKMWGRGTCDTKGSAAAFLTGLYFARLRGLRAVDRILYVATVAEETGCKGAQRLVADGFKVDAIVVGEPTMSRIVTAHKGTYWATLATEGVSCHASLPHLGRNAVYSMAKAVRFVDAEYVPRLGERTHPLLGSPTLSVGTIRGGVVTNIVPDACTATLDFRVLPADDPPEAGVRFLDALKRGVPDEKFTLSEIHSQPGVDTPADSPWVGNLLSACRRLSGQSGPEGVNYYADSGPLNAAGITCVLFGPGDIAQAHTEAEFVELEQLYTSVEICLSWLESASERSLVA